MNVVLHSVMYANECGITFSDVCKGRIKHLKESQNKAEYANTSGPILPIIHLTA